MTKTAALTSALSGSFIVGSPVTELEPRAVVEMLNWVFVNRTAEVQLCDDTPETMQNSSGWVVCRRGVLYLDVDVSYYSVLAVCTLPASQGASVRFTIGSATPVTITFLPADNGTPKTDTISRSSAGSGLVDVLIEINHTSGSSTSCTLDYLTIQAVAPTIGAAPDPP